jgi:hypothetical protein
VKPTTPMSKPDVRSYEEFWPYYVRAHSKPETRRWHVAATTAFVTTLAAFAVTRRARYLLAAPVVGYGPAWYSHFFIEGNVPATFGNPLWSLRADFEMAIRIATGTMDAEVERYCRPEAAAQGAPASVAAESPAAPAPTTDPTLN